MYKCLGESWQVESKCLIPGQCTRCSGFFWLLVYARNVLFCFPPSASRFQLQHRSLLPLFASSPSTYPVIAKTSHKPVLTASISMSRGMNLISWNLLFLHNSDRRKVYYCHCVFKKNKTSIDSGETVRLQLFAHSMEQFVICFIFLRLSLLRLAILYFWRGYAWKLKVVLRFCVCMPGS